MAKEEIVDRLALESLVKERHIALGRLATKRFGEIYRDDFGEVLGDQLTGETWVQLENPKGGERWEIRIDPSGWVELRQLYFSGAGDSWQSGTSFMFDIPTAQGQDGVENWMGPSDLDQAYLANDKYYGGLSKAVESWPTAKFVVCPIDELVE